MPLLHTTNGLMKAAAAGDLDTVLSFLKNSKDWVATLDKNGRTALHTAAENGRFAVVETLLKGGCDLDRRDNYGMTALDLSITGRHNDVVTLLLDKGARTTSDGRHATPLSNAAILNNPQAAELLLAAGASPDDGAPLLVAAQYNHAEIALALVAAGAKIDIHDAYYRYPLHWAATTGSLDLARALVEKGAGMNQRDGSNGYTPLHWAVIYGHNLVTEFLLEKGARAEIVSNNGQTPLELAYEKKNVAVIRLLEAAAKPAQAPAQAAGAEEGGEKWLRMGASRLAHVGVYPEVGRKLTEIFNFQARERIVISENLKTGQETMSQPESFDSLDEWLLQDALAAFGRLGGKADASRVMGSRAGVQKLLKGQP